MSIACHKRAWNYVVTAKIEDAFDVCECQSLLPRRANTYCQWFHYPTKLHKLPMTKQKVKKAHDSLVGERPYPQIILVDQSEFKSLVDALDYYFFTFKLCSVHLTWMWFTRVSISCHCAMRGNSTSFSIQHATSCRQVTNASETKENWHSFNKYLTSHQIRGHMLALIWETGNGIRWSNM